jgi:hypothetical protein
MCFRPRDSTLTDLLNPLNDRGAAPVPGPRHFVTSVVRFVTLPFTKAAPCVYILAFGAGVRPIAEHHPIIHMRFPVGTPKAAANIVCRTKNNRNGTRK